MSGGADAPKAASNSGTSVSNAIDLIRDPTWQAHESTWQDARYMQINNTTSGARVAALQIDVTAWLIQTGALDRPEFHRHSGTALRIAPFKLYR